MPSPILDSRVEQTIHVIWPAQLAALMLAVAAAKDADPEAEVGLLVAEGAPLLKVRARDLFPVLRLEMDRRQAKSASRQGGGT